MKSIFFFIILFAVNFITRSQVNFSKYNSEAFYYYQQNDFINAIKKFSKALEFKNEVSNSYQIAEVYINRGVCRNQLQSYSSALADFNEAIKLKPEFVKAYQYKTSLYLLTKEYQNAIDCANTGLSIKTNDMELRIKKAEALSNLKKYDEALSELFMILEHNHKNKAALKSIAHNYHLKKNWDSAVKYYSEAIIIDPLDHESYFNRGINYGENNDTINALTDIEYAMKLDTNYKSEGLNNIAYLVKFKQKHYQEAIILLNKSIVLEPTNSYGYSNRSFAKLKIGDNKGAYSDIKKALFLNPKNSYAYKNLALINISENRIHEACENLNMAVHLGYNEQYDNEVLDLLKIHCK